MNYLDVNVDLLEYVSKSKNIETITYNKKKSLEIFTPLVFISKIKDKYDNEYIKLNLEEYDKLRDLLEYIDLHAMILHDIKQSDVNKFKSSRYKGSLSCKVIKNKGRITTNISVNSLPGTIYDIKDNDKAKCSILIDTIWKDNDIISLKWKIKRCCVYRN
jgi:hypothetical protein